MTFFWKQGCDRRWIFTLSACVERSEFGGFCARDGAGKERWFAEPCASDGSCAAGDDERPARCAFCVSLTVVTGADAIFANFTF